MHKNARLTPAGRALLVQRVLAGEPRKEVALAMGVSVRTAQKWLHRWEGEGATGLQDRSSRPRRSPRRLTRGRRRQIERLRRRRWSSPRIAESLKLPVSTVVTTVRRLGLARLSRLAPPAPVIRYERSRAGELVHVDTKKFARIATIGHRIHGNQRARVRGVGWEFLHVCVDDASRLAYVEVLPDERGATAAAFLRRAALWLAQQGAPIEAVMTDNASYYLSHTFRRGLREIAARHLLTRPYTPRTNGKAERFIRTAVEEWGYARPYHTSRERTAALRTFLPYYNRTRPHAGIRRITPQQRLAELLVNNVSVIHN